MNKIEFLRKKYKLTQSQVADALGISIYHYRKLETKEEFLTPEQLTLLAQLYHVEPDFIVEDNKKLLLQKIQQCPDEWIDDINAFVEFLKFKNR